MNTRFRLLHPLPAQLILFMCTAAVAQGAVGPPSAVVAPESVRERITFNVASYAAPVNRLGTVAAKDLAIPGRAQREFDKGIKASQKGNLEKGRNHFLNAIGAFPKYSAAYNNLGVVALLKADAVEAEDWLTRALQINPENAYALMNLAKLKLAQQDPAGAEQFAKQFLVFAPSNPEGLSVLALAQLKLGKLDDAVASCLRVEASPHAGLAEIHIIASTAFERQGLPRKMIEELGKFLREGGSGDAAFDSRVRQSIKQLENRLSGLEVNIQPQP